MSQAIGFDNEKYLAQQSQAISERVHRFDNKLYLEFGGKLMYDYHASRVLPGYDPNVKMHLLQKLGGQSEVILSPDAGDIKRKHFIRKTIYLLILSILFMAYSMLGQTIKPDSAQIILKAAVTDAQSSKRNVFLIFHATWCKWCKRLEAALNDPEIKALIDRNYVVVMLDVQERGDKVQTHENPGGQNLLSGFEGNNAGLPFIVFLNRKGKMITNSNVMPKKQNIGYPGSKEEIAAFVKLLKKTAPHLTDKQRDVIQNYFELHAPK